MYKNLNSVPLGISGRQSEIIELALTYGFKGIDVDLTDLVKRTQRSSFEVAARYLTSAKMKIGGFETPVDLDSDDASFDKSLALLHSVSEIAAKVQAPTAYLRLPSATDRLPYHEFFEVLRKPVIRICEVLARQQLNLGIFFSSAVELREGKQFKFIHDVEGFLAFFKACNVSNLGIVLDTWNWTIGGGGFDQLAEIPSDKILSARVADITEGIEFGKASIKQRVLLNQTGSVDNERFVKYLSSVHYQGPLTAFGTAPTTSGRTRDSIVAFAQDYLDKLLMVAGVPTTTRKPELVRESVSASDRHSYASEMEM